MIEQTEKTDIKKIYSFDIFDTLITRTVATPTAIFDIMQERMSYLECFKNFSDSLKKNFSQIRPESQIFCQANQYILNNRHDCEFNQIYEVIKNNYNLSEEEINLLKMFEIETEYINILPVDENIGKVKRHIEMGDKVILISDMYLPSEVIRKFLVKCNSIFENIEIYTSGETGFLKTDGTLFDFVKKQYPKAKIIHYGDNKITDVLVPKLNGIKSKKYKNKDLKPYEKYLLKENNSVLAQVSVGISRFLRDYNENKVFGLGCSFAGPMLYGYVDWVLEQAINRGLEHLYFVARDGFVLKEIADIIIEQRNINLQTHYFYSSRIANRIPDENNINEFVKNFCDELRSLMTVKFFAERLNLTVNDIKQFVEVKDEKKHLSLKETKDLAEKLLLNEEFRKLVIEKNSIRKEIFKEYIKQEIDITQNNFGFVELNGTGRTQDNIAELINQMSGIENICSFFLISLSDMKQNKLSRKIFYSYPGDFLAGFLELFCRTEHGQTIGYKKEDEKIIPVLETEKYKKMEEWGYSEYLKGLKLYAKYFCKYIDDNSLRYTDINIFTIYFNYFKYYIDKETEDIVRQIPFLIYGDETKVKEFLPRYTILNIIFNFGLCKNFLATKYHGFIKRVLLLILIIYSSLNIKINDSYVYQMYYRYFLK